jgi:hypothetical protein
MKIQCSCGAKYSFDVPPESAANPVRFVCPACGVDSSNMVNELIRREFAAAATPPTPPAAAPSGSRLKISREQPPAAAPVPVSTDNHPALTACPKHPDEAATEKCAVCHKPICPKCMALFGYFCSPFCKSKADAQSLHVPTYAGSSANAQARFWRKTGLIIWSAAAAVALAVGFGVWYSLVGSVPHAIFAFHFSQRAEYGHCQNVRPDQLAVLHGGTLARFDLNSKAPVWSHELISQQDVDAAVARMGEVDMGNGMRMGGDQVQKMARAGLEAELSLMVYGSNVWLGDRTALTHYDWATGAKLESIPLGANRGELIAGDGEIIVLQETAAGAKSVTHVNYATGAAQTEAFNEAGKLLLADANANNSGSGLPSANGNPDQPLDPNKVADQAQSLTTPGRLALPALLANSMHQQQLMAEMKDGDTPRHKPTATQNAEPQEEFAMVPGKHGYIQYSIKLLEEHMVTREAMKAPPARSVVNGNLTAGQGTEAANEILNEMQRNKGGDKVTEDESLYQVTVRHSDAAGTPDWIGQVTGFPVVYSLKTVNVIAAGKSVTVLDKANKKLWDASLTYEVAPSPGGPNGEGLAGECPCVEHGDTLYVVDQAVLTAFDLASGNARWRLPSVGIVGLFIDDQGMLYVNTTTASPDKIKYSRQIDIAEAIDTMLVKVDPQSGRTLWSVKPGGFAYYVSGPYIYTVLSHDAPADDMASDLTAILRKPSLLRILRINPKNGDIMWDHDEASAPLDIRFDNNVIYLVYHNSVEVLRYLTL